MKTNKTKPIKKIMIFTIITVMIVSLFAVPAFAAITVTWREVDTSYTLEPVTMTEFANFVGHSSKSTDGMYALVFDNLISDIADAQPSSGRVNIFPGFAGRGYLELAYNDGTRRYYVFGANIGELGADITVSIYYDEAMESYALSIDTYDGRTEALSTGLATYTFYFTEYPPVEISGGSSATYFWNDHATYRVGVVSNGDTPTDPEDPDTPTPPADGEEQGIFAVWSKITQWIVQGLASVSNAFYADGKLTLLGTLCIIPLALGLAFLLIGIIQKFLRLRG